MKKKNSFSFNALIKYSQSSNNWATPVETVVTRQLIPRPENHTSVHASKLWSRGKHCAVPSRYKADNMDAVVAGKRKHFDTDEDASNRKVTSSLTSRQTWILSNWVGCVFVWQKKRKFESCFAIMLINSPNGVARLLCGWFHINGTVFTQKHQAETGEKKHTSIVFALKEKVGSLARALKLFEVNILAYSPL